MFGKQIFVSGLLLCSVAAHAQFGEQQAAIDISNNLNSAPVGAPGGLPPALPGAGPGLSNPAAGFAPVAPGGAPVFPGAAPGTQGFPQSGAGFNQAGQPVAATPTPEPTVKVLVGKRV